MDAIELLMQEQDHKRIRMLFEVIERQNQSLATSMSAMMTDNEDGALASSDAIPVGRGQCAVLDDWHIQPSQ